MLVINNLHVAIQDEKKNIKPILKGLDLTIKAGEIHAIMGPNGSGKSTLANLLAGKSGYEVTSGHIYFDDEMLTALSPEIRALRGIFLGFQYPIEIPGVNNIYFLRTALNRLRKAKGMTALDAHDFLVLAKEKIKQVGLPEDFLHRPLNEGFSGGEKSETKYCKC